MASARKRRLAQVLLGVTVLSACESGQGFDLFGASQGAENTGIAVAASQGSAVEKDVESPDIFQVTDAGLWDGRPSLGGVWIAHPDVTDPERVLIRNQDNGRSIVGALFRRERENPGPRFQVSSDAAAELGMLAGAPISLSVVALRREVVEVVPEPVAIAAPAAIETATIDATTDEPLAIAVAPAEPVETIAGIAASAIEAATENNPTASLPETATATEPPVEAAVAVAPVARPQSEPLSALNKPYIQLGIFSVQSNAGDTSDLLRAAGIIPTIRTYTQVGKPYWRVLVGPIASSAERADLINQVKGLGFQDAYAVTN